MIFLKFILSFIISFFILSFPIGDRTIFSYLHELTSPWTKQVFQKMKISVYQSSDWGRRIFTNSTPEKEEIFSKQSSAPKKKVQRELSGDPMEESYTPEEREFLKKILEENRRY